jgi:endoglucanase
MEQLKLHTQQRAMYLLFSLGLGCACSVQPDSEPPVVDHRKQEVRDIEQGPITQPPEPQATTGNPLAGAKLFVDPESLAMLRANALRADQPEQAQLLDRIAQQPMALWMGGWNSDIYRAVDHYVSRAHAEGAVPVMIAYNIPERDCGQYSQGGVASGEEYQRWIRLIRAGIAQRQAVVVLEPDALGMLTECLNEEQQHQRLSLLQDAIKVLRQDSTTIVYLDAGHARWLPAPVMAQRLQEAGVAHAHGFALNVSNYVSTEENLKYGHALADLLESKPFVIDTSRNGNGAYEQAKTIEESWCNPPDRTLGQTPSTNTGDSLCQAYLWLKRPGESDGECNGGPVAGAFWLEQALSMARSD